MTDTLPQLTRNGNQNNTQDYNYIMETASEINDTKEISEGTFPINLNTIDIYKRQYPGLIEKLKTSKYIRG